MSQPSKETPDEIRKQRNAARRKRREQAAQRQIGVYIFTLLALAGLYWYARGDLTPSDSYTARAAVVLEQAQQTMLRREQQSPAEQLVEGDLRRLDGQREFARELARRHVGSPLRGGERDDLRVLQVLIDDRVLRRDETYELQSLGVALGDVMARQLDLDWIIVDDRWGRTRALRFGENDDFFFPTTMISRRYEKNIPVDVRALYREVEAEVERLREHYGS